MATSLKCASNHKAAASSVTKVITAFVATHVLSLFTILKNTKLSTVLSTQTDWTCASTVIFVPSPTLSKSYQSASSIKWQWIKTSTCSTTKRSGAPTATESTKEMFASTRTTGKIFEERRIALCTLQLNAKAGSKTRTRVATRMAVV